MIIKLERSSLDTLEVIYWYGWYMMVIFHVLFHLLQLMYGSLQATEEKKKKNNNVFFFISDSPLFPVDMKIINANSTSVLSTLHHWM